jgi:hypothetical protein
MAGEKMGIPSLWAALSREPSSGRSDPKRSSIALIERPFLSSSPKLSRTFQQSLSKSWKASSST